MTGSTSKARGRRAKREKERQRREREGGRERERGSPSLQEVLLGLELNSPNCRIRRKLQGKLD